MRLVKNDNCYYYGDVFNKRIVINIETGIITIKTENKNYTIFDPMWIQGSIAEEDHYWNIYMKLIKKIKQYSD